LWNLSVLSRGFFAAALFSTTHHCDLSGTLSQNHLFWVVARNGWRLHIFFASLDEE
jgi:hypothetical protein